MKKIPDETKSLPKPTATVVRELNEKLGVLAKECQKDGFFLIGAWGLECKTTHEIRCGFVGLTKPFAMLWLYSLACWKKLILSIVLDGVEFAQKPNQTLPPPPNLQR